MVRRTAGSQKKSSLESLALSKSQLRERRKSIFELQGKDKEKRSPIKVDDKDKIIEPKSRTFNKLKERILANRKHRAETSLDKISKDLSIFALHKSQK